MRRTRTTGAAVAAAAVALSAMAVFPGSASAQPDPQPEVETPAPEVLHNVTYRVRVDGVSRGATVVYRGEDARLQTANPTMVPGRIFEVMTVLPDSDVANLRLSIDWPYSANLHCEILVDDALVAQADDFIAPRVLPQRDDPDYGALTCEAPVSGIANVSPVDPTAPLPPGEPAPPPPA